MASSTSWIYAMRAETLAKLILTRRPDLDVLTTSGSFRGGYDLLVRITGTGLSLTPEFGVLTKGIDQPLTSTRWRSSVLRSVVRLEDRDGARGTDQFLPVCLFVFNIDTEEGLYLWLKEPQVEKDGNSRVQLSTYPRASGENGNDLGKSGAPFEKLDNDAVARIVERVVEWYRARDRLLQQSNGSMDRGLAAWNESSN